jgi:hypothetical protein
MVLAAFANRSTWGVAMAQTSARTPTTHCGRRRLRLVRSKSVGGTSYWSILPRGIFVRFLMRTLSANRSACWHSNDPSKCAVVIRTPLETSYALGLVKIRWGDE